VIEAGRLRAGPQEDPVELGPGDYAAFDAGVPHLYAALGRHAVRAVLLIVSAR
jgi:quercetin dioxygenase-like cupin family protein